MNLNPEMVILAREFRGLTQEELARRLCISQARVARIEGGLKTEVENAILESLTEQLGFPSEFFTQEEDRIGFGSSAYFYRKKAELLASDRKRIHGVVNLLRIAVKRFNSFVEIDAQRPLPMFDLAEFDGNAAKVAQALRGLWKLPDGPVKNLTALLEAAGVVVIPCDFGTRAMDATSLRLAEMPPLIFINADIPGDRWRYTVAHELGHIVMHEAPHESMEDEADTFAAEFLVPEIEIRAQFSRYPKLRLQDLANLKPYWKVSMAFLLVRAHTLGYLDDNQRRYLWMTMSKLNMRLREPNPIEREQPKTLRRFLDFFYEKLKYTPDDFAKLLRLNPPELRSLLGVASSGLVEPAGRKMRIVQGAR
jgi:Zn-dependent peptidase ImmA (M78 family)/transcriptional regulator with XRE-family HTH domain